MPRSRAPGPASTNPLLISLVALLLLPGAAGTGAARDAPELPDSSAPTGFETGLAPPKAVVESEPAAARLPTTSYLRIAGSVVRPRSSAISFVASGGGGCTYHTGGSTSTVWNTPVYLPAGTTVNTVRMYFDDTSASNSRGWFTVHDLYGGIVDEWGVNSSGSAGNGFEDTASIDHRIDYQVNSYVLNWRPNESGSDMQLCGFRIFYFDPNLFFDDFESGNTGAWSLVFP